MQLLISIVFYLISFVAIWIGADLIVRSVIRFSHKLRISSFSASFFILGFLTSLPEFALGLTAINSHNPDIFVGNLIGGVIVIFLFIIPILAILGNSIKITHELNKWSLIFSLAVTAAPSLIILDHRVTNTESVLLILLYLALFYVIESKHGVLALSNNHLNDTKSYSIKDLLLLLTGVLIVFVSSHFIVNQTLVFSRMLHLSPLLMSIIFLSLGTNLPEMSLAVKAIVTGHKEVAFGNYMGSAAVNTFLFGFFSLINNGEVLTSNNFLVNLIFILLGMGLFFHFSRSKNNISVKEGLVLLLAYFVYAVFWMLSGRT